MVKFTLRTVQVFEARIRPRRCFIFSLFKCRLRTDVLENNNAKNKPSLQFTVCTSTVDEEKLLLLSALGKVLYAALFNQGSSNDNDVAAVILLASIRVLKTFLYETAFYCNNTFSILCS